jgi:proline iminopeptidase
MSTISSRATPPNSRQTRSPCRRLALIWTFRRRGGTSSTPEDRCDVVKGLAKAFSSPPQTDAERERLVKVASACVSWEGTASRLNRGENSHGQPNQKYVLTAARILVHYMFNGGFLGADGAANRDNNYILDHIARLKHIPVHVVHGRYDRVCHLYQAEALVRALRDAGNNAVNYFITTSGHSSS